MPIKDYQQLQELICKELNVHEVKRFICTTEKGDLYLCVSSDLGFGKSAVAQNGIFLRLNDKRIRNDKLLREIIKEL